VTFNPYFAIESQIQHPLLIPVGEMKNQGCTVCFLDFGQADP
jgi:hypothetical protein